MKPNQLFGTWLSAGSEIPDHQVGSEAYHFFEPDIFLLEFKSDLGRSTISRSRFEVTENGFRYGPRSNKVFEVNAWFEAGYLIFRPSHGMETWFSRVCDDSFPEWIRGRDLVRKKL